MYNANDIAEQIQIEKEQLAKEERTLPKKEEREPTWSVNIYNAKASDYYGVLLAAHICGDWMFEYFHKLSKGFLGNNGFQTSYDQWLKDAKQCEVITPGKGHYNYFGKLNDLE